MSRLAAAGFDEGFKCLQFRLELWQPFLDDSSFKVSLKGVRAVGDAKPPDFGSAKGFSDFHGPHACMHVLLSVAQIGSSRIPETNRAQRLISNPTDQTTNPNPRNLRPPEKSLEPGAIQILPIMIKMIPHICIYILL